jgi:hypothetical protein
MAKNIGLIKISGKVGDLQFFQKDGKTYVGLTSSVSKDRILKDPAFKRTRENMAEFGAAATISKAIREKIIPLSGLIEKNLHARLMAPLRALIDLGSGVRGKRMAEFSLYGEDLVGFELNKNTKMSEVMLITGDVVTNADRNQLVYTLPEFMPVDYLQVPAGATHFRVYLAGLSLSDFGPVPPKNKYRATNAAQNGIFAVEASTLLSVDDLVTGGLSLTVNLPGAPVLDTDVKLVAFVGIEFVQEINGLFYQFASNNAIRIDRLF